MICGMYWNSVLWLLASGAAEQVETGEWWPKILAVLVAAYALVRAIIAATPTKNDDEWLKANINPVVYRLAQFFGLNLNQGRKLKP